MSVYKYISYKHAYKYIQAKKNIEITTGHTKCFLFVQVVKISHSNCVSSQKLENTPTTETHPMASLRKRSAWSASPCRRASGFFHPSDNGNFQRNPSHPQNISLGLYFSAQLHTIRENVGLQKSLHCKWVSSDSHDILPPSSDTSLDSALRVIPKKKRFADSPLKSCQSHWSCQVQPQQHTKRNSCHGKLLAHKTLQTWHANNMT